MFAAFMHRIMQVDKFIGHKERVSSFPFWNLMKIIVIVAR